MTDWRELPYGDREFSLVSDELRSRSWMDKELTLALDDALAALDSFEQAGATLVQWETLNGLPGGRIGGGFQIAGKHCVCGTADDFTIAEARDAMVAEAHRLRAEASGVGDVLFCLMVMDGVT